MTKQLRNFSEFIKNQGVVGLAVGLAIGTQVGKVVESLVKNLLNPVVGFIIGDNGNLQNLNVTIHVGSRKMEIGWGAVVSSLITLLVVSALIYFVVTGFNLHNQKLEKKK